MASIDTPDFIRATRLQGLRIVGRTCRRLVRILILDEATSALDYESERILKDNMQAIRAGRTVLIVAHRLSTVRDADRILVVEHGAIVEDGGHAELVLRPQGRYAHLHAMQMG